MTRPASERGREAGKAGGQGPSFAMMPIALCHSLYHFMRTDSQRMQVTCGPKQFFRFQDRQQSPVASNRGQLRP
jgi:hypothetical protein